jgi:hypothetical protein
MENFEKLSNLIGGLSEGIVTGLNKFYLLSYDDIKSNNFEMDYFQKCIRGKEIKKNIIQESNFFVFYPYYELNGKTIVIDENALKQKCPNYYNFLLTNKDEIISRDYFKKSNKKWYELWNQRSITQFKKDKIVTPELSSSSNFSFTNSDYFYGDTVCGITLKEDSKISLRSLLAILNSKLVEFFFKSTTVPKAGGFYIYKVMFLKDIPIAIPDSIQTTRIDKFQKDLLNMSQPDPLIEKSIDKIVYELYGLTEEEIKIVEGKSNL